MGTPLETTELDLFSQPPTVGEVESRHWIYYKSSIPVTDESGVIFDVPQSETLYTDLYNTFLNISVTLTHKDGTPVPSMDDHPMRSTEKVGPANFVLSSFFQQCDLYLQNVNVSTGIQNHYPYKAYLDVMTSKGTERYEGQHDLEE